MSLQRTGGNLKTVEGLVKSPWYQKAGKGMSFCFRLNLPLRKNIQLRQSVLPFWSYNRATKKSEFLGQHFRKQGSPEW